MFHTDAVTQQTGQYDWLVTKFATETPGVSHAILVSADGLLMASSDQHPRQSAPSRSPPSPPAWRASPSVRPASSRAGRSCRPSSRWSSAT